MIAPRQGLQSLDAGGFFANQYHVHVYGGLELRKRNPPLGARGARGNEQGKSNPSSIYPSDPRGPRDFSLLARN
jgi:hypothetical protein